MLQKVLGDFVVVIQNGQVQRAETVRVEHVDLRPTLDQALDVFEVAFLRRYVRCCISVIVLDVEIEARAD